MLNERKYGAGKNLKSVCGNALCLALEHTVTQAPPIANNVKQPRIPANHAY
jgi:hypothetical protein